MLRPYPPSWQEIAEPLFHLKLAMEQLSASHTFRYVLATVLAIGNFLNGSKVSIPSLVSILNPHFQYNWGLLCYKARGFELSYLEKLSQVRDTHTRQPLLYHVCVLLMQRYPQSSDFYSDITSVTKAAKVGPVWISSPIQHYLEITNTVLATTRVNKLNCLSKTKMGYLTFLNTFFHSVTTPKYRTISHS